MRPIRFASRIITESISNETLTWSKRGIGDNVRVSGTFESVNLV